MASLEVEALANALRPTMGEFAMSGTFIVAAGCEAHRYNVKRPSLDERGQLYTKVYEYNKLASRQAIFVSAQQPRQVSVIHLSKDDPRNLEARLGVERRDRPRRVAARLRAACDALDRASGALGRVDIE